MPYEERLIKNQNGFWVAQCRMGEDDHWRSFFISKVLENTIDRMKPEFTRSYWDVREEVWYDWDY